MAVRLDVEGDPMARRDDDPGLPIKLHPCSNGEFMPPPATPAGARGGPPGPGRRPRRTPAASGMSRRRFLLSSMGAATTLAALSACAERGGAGRVARLDRRAAPTPSRPRPTTEPDAAKDAVLGGEEFIFDVQTHFLDHEPRRARPRRRRSRRTRCGEQDARDCFTVDKYLDLLFNQSDTNMIVISALPFAGSPLDPEVMTQDHRPRRPAVRRPAHAHAGRGPPVGRAAAGLPRQHGRAEAHAAHRRVEDVHPRRRPGLVPRRPRPGGARRSARRSSTRSASSARRSSPCTRASPASAATRRTPIRSTSVRRPRPTPTSTSSCTTRASTSASVEREYVETDAYGVEMIVFVLRLGRLLLPSIRNFRGG